MNILGVFLINEIRTGGDRRYIELLELLAERGHKVFVLINTYLDYTPKFVHPIHLPVKYVRHKFPPASFLFKKAVQKNISNIRQELENAGFSKGLIHIHGDIYLKAAIFLKKALGLRFFYASRCNDVDRARILRKSGSLSVKEYIFSLAYEPVNLSREKQIARHAELITFQNAADKDIFVKRTAYPNEKTVIIPGNIGLPRCKPEWENANHSESLRTIVYVGAISVSKGLPDLLSVLAELKRRGLGSLRCYALGRNTGNGSVEYLIEKLMLEEMVILEGFKSPFPYLTSCDLMIYPTLYDAYPDTVLEALHTGCPVLASAVGGIPELLAYPDLLFPAGDIDAAADRVERCIVEPAFYQHLRDLCAERAEAHRFDWAGRFEAAMAEL
jgi:glycosyltransferase involved in cell wall biosynthesis